MREAYVSVELANETGEIVVFEVLGKQISGEFGRSPDDERRSILAPRY